MAPPSTSPFYLGEVAGFITRRDRDGLREFIDDNHITSSQLSTYLSNAAQVDDTQIMALLLERGAAVNQTDMYGNTALHHAQSGEMTELLLQYDANPHLLNRQGQTPQQAQESRLNEQLAWQEKELSDPRLSAGVVEMVANGYKERHDKLDRSIRSVETAAKKTDFIEIYGLAKEYRKDGYLSTNISYQQDHETGVIRNHNQADVEGSMIEPEVKAFLNGRPVPLEELGDINEVLDRTAPPFAPTMAAPTPTPTPEPSKAEPAFMPKPESLPEHPFKELILTYIPTDPNDNITNGTLTLARATGLPEMPLAKHAPTANKPSRGGP